MPDGSDINSMESTTMPAGRSWRYRAGARDNIFAIADTCIQAANVSLPRGPGISEAAPSPLCLQDVALYQRKERSWRSKSTAAPSLTVIRAMVAQPNPARSVKRRSAVPRAAAFETNSNLQGNPGNAGSRIIAANCGNPVDIEQRPGPYSAHPEVAVPYRRGDQDQGTRWGILAAVGEGQPGRQPFMLLVHNI